MEMVRVARYLHASFILGDRLHCSDDGDAVQAPRRPDEDLSCYQLMPQLVTGPDHRRRDQSGCQQLTLVAVLLM